MTFTVTEDQKRGTMSVTASAVKITAGSGANIAVGMGAPLFVNIYTEPKKEVPAGDDEEIIPGVETGDTVEIIPVLFAMVTAISVIIAMSAVMIRRRRK